VAPAENGVVGAPGSRREGHLEDNFIVTAFVLLDKTMATLGHRDDVRAGASDAAVLTVAVVAAKYFQHHLARAVQVLRLVLAQSTCSGNMPISGANVRKLRGSPIPGRARIMP